MTQIPKPDSDFMPLGTILPFLTAAEVDPNYLILQGQTVTSKDYPELVAKMWKRWQVNPLELWVMSAQAFWIEHGGAVQQDFVILPTISHQKVAALAFGVSYLPPDARPVLAIKARRDVIYEYNGETSDVDNSDSDA